MIGRLVLLGATGDLAGRFVLPALAGLVAAGRLPADLQVTGGAQQDWDDDAFRAHVAARWAVHAADVPDDVRTALLGRLRYRRLDPSDPRTVAEAVRSTAPHASAAQAPVAVYLALPAGLFEPTLRALGTASLPAGSRVAVEKPFGDDLAGAHARNALLAHLGGGHEDAVLRVDHILAMPKVEDLRRAHGTDGPLAAVWDGGHVHQVDVLWEETLGLESRAGFYDRTGAVRDVLQNHLLQILALVAMEPPASGADRDLHRAKAELLASVRVLSAEQVPSRTARARYTAGRLAAADAAGGDVRGYARADGVDPARLTETYAEVVLEIDTPRWAGTRFVLRTGKALAVDRKGVAVHFRGPAPTPPPPGAEVASATTLWFELDGPRRSDRDPTLSVNAPGELAAYRQVLLDVLGGGSRTSVSAQEAELAWRIVEPVLRAWSDGAVPMLEYPAGSAGPPRLGEVPGPPVA